VAREEVVVVVVVAVLVVGKEIGRRLISNVPR
jgi:hypothetical protein